MRSGGTPSRTNLDYWNGDVPWASSKDLKRDTLADTKDHITQRAVHEGAAELVPAGAVLIVVRGMILAHTFPVAKTTTQLAINQDLKALSTRNALSPNFLAWLLRGASRETLSRVDEAGHGTKVLRIESWTSMPIVVPPLAEQCLITAFLDRETAKIDALVAEQRRLMDLLAEKRQAVISVAVSKGLNSCTPMKPSGTGWMGDIPAHWRAVSLGRVTLSRCDGPFGSGLKSMHYEASGVRVIRLQNIRRDGFDDSDEAYIDCDYYAQSLGGHDVIEGDVLLAGLGDENNTVGRACVAPCGIEPAMVKADCFRFRLNVSQVLADFAAAQLSAGSTADAGRLASGSTRSRISLSAMATRRIAIPPVAEQRAILEYLHFESSRFEVLTAEARRAIELLRERRAALISAAVTGQIDVRETFDETPS